MITQEDRENVVDMHKRGLSINNIAAITGIPENLVGAVTAQIKVVVPKREKPKKAPEVKPEVPWVSPESLGLEENWEVEGLCRTGGYDPDLWFPSSTDINLMKLAQRVCYRCPVIMECRSIAVARGERNGIWGGLTETQRKKMRKRDRERQQEQEAEAV